MKTIEELYGQTREPNPWPTNKGAMRQVYTEAVRQRRFQSEVRRMRQGVLALRVAVLLLGIAFGVSVWGLWGHWQTLAFWWGR